MNYFKKLKIWFFLKILIRFLWLVFFKFYIWFLLFIEDLFIKDRFLIFFNQVSLSFLSFILSDDVDNIWLIFCSSQFRDWCVLHFSFDFPMGSLLLCLLFLFLCDSIQFIKCFWPLKLICCRQTSNRIQIDSTCSSHRNLSRFSPNYNRSSFHLWFLFLLLFHLFKHIMKLLNRFFKIRLLALNFNFLFIKFLTLRLLFDWRFGLIHHLIKNFLGFLFSR